MFVLEVGSGSERIAHGRLFSSLQRRVRKLRHRGRYAGKQWVISELYDNGDKLARDSGMIPKQTKETT